MGIKIKDLPIVTEVKDSDYILIDDAESTNKININNLLTIDNIDNLQLSLDNKQQKIAVNQPYTQGTLTSITIDGVNYRVSSAAVVSDYLNLNNTPKINGIDLGKKLDEEGNPVSQSSSDLLLQDKLISGETIKTINNESLLGSGNIEIKSSASIFFGNGEDTPIIDETINKIYPVGSVYFSVDNIDPSTLFGGTWELIGNKLAVRENIFGNGLSLALTNGTVLGSAAVLTTGGSGTQNQLGFSSAFGLNAGTATSRIGINSNTSVGLPTKEQLGDNLENSGIIVDTETIYSWKRIS